MNLPQLDPNFLYVWNQVLLHSVWQGVVVLLVAQFCLWSLRNASANARYLMLVGAQLALILCLPITYVVLARSVNAPPPQRPPQIALDVTEPADLTGLTGRYDQIQSFSAQPATATTSEDRSRYFAIGYFAGAGLMLCRLVAGFFGGKVLVARSTPITEPPILASIARAVIAMRFSYTPAMAFCGSIAVPSVVGVLRPTLLLPMVVVSGLTPAELDLLVMHELAHIRRHDHIINLLQRLAEVFLFYHPSSWLIARQIRHERELCCDDAVIAAGGSQKEYASSLLRMVEISIADPITNVGLVQLAATGDVSELRSRIARLTRNPAAHTVRLKRVGAVVATLVIFGAFVTPLGMAMKLEPKGNEQLAQLAEKIRGNPALITDRYGRGWTRLHTAVRSGSPEEIQLWLSQGADINARQDTGWTPLHLAVALDRPDVVSLLVKSGADIDATNTDGQSALHIATGMASRGETQSAAPDRRMIELLCKLGAKVNLADHRGLTPMFGAVTTRNPSVAEALLRYGANLNARDQNRRTPLFNACLIADRTMIRWLLEHRADPNAVDSREMNAIDALVLQPPARNVVDRQTCSDCFDILQEFGVTASIRAAAAMGYAEMVEQILTQSPQRVDERPARAVNTFTPMDWAIEASSAATCQVLLSHGADVNLEAENHQTPLHRALFREDPNEEIIAMLIGAGADLARRDELGRTPLYVACARRFPQIVQRFIAAGADVSPLDKEIQTPLHRLMLVQNANTDQGVIDTTRVLLQAGAKLDAANLEGNTPLHLAASHQWDALLEIFLKAGGDFDLKNKHGQSPRQLAMEAQHPTEAMQALLKRWAPTQP